MCLHETIYKRVAPQRITARPSREPLLSKSRLLSKSLFKIGCECPTKLYFTGKSQFGNTNLDNAFLEALAEGGFQVGALAKLYHPGGIEIEGLDVSLAVQKTKELLERDEVVLYEPAIQFGDLLVRVDVLAKKGNAIELIEVKAKSFDPGEDNPFYNKTQLKKGVFQLNGAWEPYLLDVAFQKYVLSQAYPHWAISAFLMLADKSSRASVDGINQRFFLQKKSSDKVSVIVAPGTTQRDLGDQLLIKVPVDEALQAAYNSDYNGRTFAEHVAFLASSYRDDEMVPPLIGSHCKGCEFRLGEAEKESGLQSGFDLCWKSAAQLTPADLAKPLVFDIWNFRGAQQLIEKHHFLMSQVSEEDIAPTPRREGPGLSSSERQWLQVQMESGSESNPYIDRAGIAAEMESWNYPLHFIDFETTMVAIPFHKGLRPYEQIAFQFSHHVVSKTGKIEHKTEYINRVRGKFPNFEFVRSLKKALSGDNGTIFRFAAHENTVLCQIHSQLSSSSEEDRDDLMAWIETITQSTGAADHSWEGQRNMVDMCELVKRYFYHPLTGGSNSIKKVLPAILQTSQYLQNLYSNPVYGTSDGVGSKNYKNWQWIKRDSDGTVVDPYKLLPPIFSDIEIAEMDALITDGSIADGGAAMTAYARMQFTQMSEAECERVTNALLKYCELDTFAMVLIYEYWREAVRLKTSRAA